LCPVENTQDQDAIRTELIDHNIGCAADDHFARRIDSANPTQFGKIGELIADSFNPRIDPNGCDRIPLKDIAEYSFSISLGQCRPEKPQAMSLLALSFSTIAKASSCSRENFKLTVACGLAGR
jgi:hypothetical protein